MTSLHATRHSNKALNDLKRVWERSPAHARSIVASVLGEGWFDQQTDVLQRENTERQTKIRRLYDEIVQIDKEAGRKAVEEFRRVLWKAREQMTSRDFA
ncbi:hypothetical protein BU24DRAFT_498076 [Aaosphaeria arxii CBS 175.79]|uniref:Uncharacterized protein n=1 Tax=Aaosphaeria arxii CBS 175.79 TaxID=1450172 RepID=A0A6A5X5Y5_9PLEO|nr:uncharacterized protein BU24DRAFT_498076 [Aaosphaeria arxii CBS 175.79]KAF2008281.1 hypothetical protein BU24DRAFT_498076 [Aaosphaeria arxii CBS 175.79]